MPGTGQQEITTYAQAVHAAQRDRRRKRRPRGRPRAAIYVSRLRYAQSSLPHGVAGKVILDFGLTGGLAAFEGREAVVTMTHAELGQALGAVPAGDAPETVTAAITILRAWLGQGPRS